MSIELSNVSKTYKKNQVLKNINLIFEENTIYGLLGRNGAGKSTLLNIINNRIFSDTGECLFQNETNLDNEKIQRHFFLTSENDLYPEQMKIKNIFKWTEEFYGDFDFGLANQLAAKFKLDTTKKFGKLSTGYRSIAKLIVALCVPCRFIFLDEPVLGLDATHRDLFYKELIAAYMDRPRTFVISTHLIEEIANLLEKIILIKNGEIILNASTEEILSRASTISGEKFAVETFIKPYQIIGTDSLGNHMTAYTLDVIDRTILPEEIMIEPMDLQKLFINLTKEESEL
ncbi:MULTISPECIES: ATP-binding cassette domain-containing protein [unclassified Enterococcus]|jgi:ABC-2 type transport system ATP-binding protein|uniref:ATP-binding cassette domain-containing protein n=1 Tax=unclassified Enterococcus TaxID=2608891 RepID=UPI003D27A19B